jgi:pyruvate/2-oxoglutarate dehydrogenase complex dihydrolipoamide dehydrogenase (E3) component
MIGSESYSFMAETLKPDICVIGGGPGGLAVATATAAFGVPTVLVECRKMGGNSLNAGCVPSKALLAAARRTEAARSAKRFGIDARDAGVNFSGVHRHIHSVIAAVGRTDSFERLRGLGIRVIHAQARFKDRNTVVAGDIEIRARRFVIATGSKPTLPAIPGLDSGSCLTSESIFDLTERPEHLIIIGAGPTGVELAQGFRRLGSSVTLLEAGQPLGQDDPECAAVVLAQLEREGIVIRSPVNVVGIAHAGRAVTATIESGGAEQTVTGSHLLVAAGRSPSIADLGLDNAGIRHDKSGIVVNRKLKTKNRRVYAIGDCIAGAGQFRHAADYHAGLVIRNALFRLPVRVNDACVPWVIFTDPELAQIGLTEAQARQQDVKICVTRWPYHDNDRALAEGAPHGHIKVITTAIGKIVGVTIVGAQAGELIAMWILAVVRNLRLRDIAGLILPYPTLSEIGKRAAIDYFMPSLIGVWTRRIIGWMRIFG